MPEELTIADIQQAFFEYRANFKEPIVTSWFEKRQGEIVGVLLKVLSEWGVTLENITWNQAPKNLREVQLTFGVPSLSASIQVDLGGATMSAFNPDWSRAPALLSLFQTVFGALKRSTGQDILLQQTTLGLHVKPGVKPFRGVVSQFVNPGALGSEDAAMFGVSVYYNDYSFVIDGSVVVPGGVFIKLIRNFPSEKRFEEMAATLHSDEETVLRRLGLKLQ
jgi:hypothetical protein